MGFGFFATIYSPVKGSLIESVGIANTFFLLRTMFLMVMIPSTLYLEKRPKEFMGNKEKEDNKKKFRPLTVKRNVLDNFSIIFI